MSDDITSWEQSPAGLIRNQGLVPSTAAADRALEITSPDRIAARRSFEAAWAGSGTLAAQQALVERGWQGCWIDVPGPLIAPELAPLGISARAEQSQMSVYVPDAGGRGLRPANANAEQLDREYAAKRAAAQAAMDRVNAHRADDGRFYPGDLGRTVAGGRPADAAWWD